MIVDGKLGMFIDIFKDLYDTIAAKYELNPNATIKLGHFQYSLSSGAASIGECLFKCQLDPVCKFVRYYGTYCGLGRFTYWTYSISSSSASAVVYQLKGIDAENGKYYLPVKMESHVRL